MITSVVGAGIGRWTHLDSDLGTRASGHGQAALRHGEWCTFACNRLTIFMCTPTGRDSWWSAAAGVRTRAGRAGVGDLVRTSVVSGWSARCPAAAAREARVSERVTWWCP